MCHYDILLIYSGPVHTSTEGQLTLLYLQNPRQFPNDGIRYQDQETRYALPIANRVCNPT